MDPVQAEVNGWLSMLPTEIENHRDSRGWLDEFALMSAMRVKFPIHCCVFKRARHLIIRMRLIVKISLLW